jgi:ubiquinone/menaquinone biosynthesis C-methylase UbiE
MTEHMATIDRVDYDTELQRHNAVLHSAWDIRPRDHVLDVGCGGGQTTRDAARLAEAGSALGVDISASMIERAQALAEAEGLHNVAFVHADASDHRFPPDEFDVVISRFGTMFFADPVAAFANLVRSLRHSGRLVMMVWQDAERNEWEVSIRRALAIDVAVPAASPTVPDAFSLANPSTIERILDASGLADITLTGVQEPVYYGAHVAAALDWVCGFSSTKEALRQMAPADRERSLAALRETLAAHDTGHGIWFDSRAWIVTARRR